MLVTWHGDSSYTPSHRNLSATILEDGASTQLTRLLEAYNTLFEETQGLPPSRGFSHKIILEQGTNPIVVRPYRYPHM